MNLDRIKYFVTLAEQLHFGRAADILYISQSTLSYNISELEKELKTTLFVRNNRKVLLSSSGVALLPKAKELLECAERFEQFVEEHIEEEQEIHHLKLALDTAFSRVDLLSFSAALTDLREAHPQLNPKIYFQNFDEMLANTEKMDIDICFGYLREDDRVSKMLNVLPLFEDELILVHNLPNVDDKTAEELAHEQQLYLLKDDPRWSDYIMNYLEMDGPVDEPIMSNNFNEMYASVRLGSGVTITTMVDVGVVGGSRDQGFKTVKFTKNVCKMKLCAIWAKGNYNYAIMELLSRLKVDPDLHSLTW